MTHRLRGYRGSVVSVASVRQKCVTCNTHTHTRTHWWGVIIIKWSLHCRHHCRRRRRTKHALRRSGCVQTTRRRRTAALEVPLSIFGVCVCVITAQYADCRLWCCCCSSAGAVTLHNSSTEQHVTGRGTNTLVTWPLLLSRRRGLCTLTEATKHWGRYRRKKLCSPLATGRNACEWSIQHFVTVLQ